MNTVGIRLEDPEGRDPVVMLEGLEVVVMEAVVMEAVVLELVVAVVVRAAPVVEGLD